nr:hypothetical protein [Tanacetum cinerariifolium]
MFKKEENYVVPKPVTLQTSPDKQKGANSNKNIIAPGMYKVVTTQESQTNKAKSALSSTGMNTASSVKRSMNRDSHDKNSVLANSKNLAKKVAVYVVQIILWIIDSGCSKHMMGDRSLLRNFIENSWAPFALKIIILQGKNKKASHPPKLVPSDNSKLELLHMYLCGPMRPNVEYFHVFGSLCYPTNDRDDLGKMKPKADIVVFIGYSETSRGFRIYNQCTKKIMETIHFKFDELTAMASEYHCLEPELQRFNNHNSSAELMNTPSKEYLDNLFGPMFEEYFRKKSSYTSSNFVAQPTQFHEDSPSTSLINVEEHEAPPIETTSDEQTSLISLTEADEFHQEDSTNFDGNA